jgi:hypothetical protein
MHLPRAPGASRLDCKPKRAVHRRRCITGSSICQSVLDPGSVATGFGSFGRTAGFGCFGGGAGDALASAIGMGVVLGRAGSESVVREYGLSGSG